MKRKIIIINEEKCTGCGECVPHCPEGALQIIDGKARLVGELLCDGLGACIGRCPEGAITIEERDVEPYSETKVMEKIVQGGPEVITAHLKHLQDHHQEEYFREALTYLEKHHLPVPRMTQPRRRTHQGCPGMMARDFRREENTTSPDPSLPDGGMGRSLRSQLGQWPIQLHLLNSYAPYFRDAHIVIAADCVPFAHPNFHERFLKGKILIIFCPKLDQSEDIYLEKLTQIIKENHIQSITMVHMEVPCCFGTVALVQEALQQSKKNIILKDYTVSLKGEVV